MTVGDGTFSYDETTSIAHARLLELLLHRDTNTLKRVATPEGYGEVSRHQR